MKKYFAMLVIAVAIFVMPLTGFAGDTEVMFNYKVASDRPSSLKIAPDGKTAWATTATQTLFRFTGAKRDEFSKDDFAGNSCGGFNLLAFDTKGTLWIRLECYKDGYVSMLATYDGSAWKIQTRYIFPLPEGVKGVELMAFDKNNVMWLVGGSGLHRYDGKEWKSFTIKNSPIPERQITALNIDKNGAVWIGTAGGHIGKFDGTRWDIFKAGSTTNGLQYASMAKSIKFDVNGVMYFTGYTGGVYRYVGGKFQLLKLQCANTSYYETDVAFDAQNVLWVANDGTSSNPGDYPQPDPGLFRYDGRKCRTFNLPVNTSLLLEIDAAGNKWIATRKSIILFREGGVKLAQ